MNSRDKKLLVLIGILVLILAVVLVGIFIYLGKDEGNDSKNGNIIISSDVSSEDESYEEVLTHGIEIETPYGTIFYPEKWESYAEIETSEGNPYTVSFYAKIGGHEKQAIFEIFFGESFGDYLGNVEGKDGIIYPVYSRVYDVDELEGWAESETATIKSMQQEINRVVNQFTFTDEAPDASVSSVGYIEIETEYVVLYYSAMWKEWIKTEASADGKTIRFFAVIGNHDEIRLFDVLFDGNGEVAVGELETENQGTVNISISTYEPEFDESWTEEEKQIVFGMREGMNGIIEKLGEEENFAIEY